MRLLFLAGLLITSPLFGQEKYAFVHFNTSNVSEEIDTFLKENGQVLLLGRLSNKSTWALFEADANEVTRLKSVFKTDIVYWNQRRGTPCKVNGPKENSQFTFVKYNSHITKFNVQDAPELFRLHDEHIKEIAKTGSVLLEGIFDNDDGGFMVMHGTVDKEVILADPAVINGIIEPGSFLTSIKIEQGCN